MLVGRQKPSKLLRYIMRGSVCSQHADDAPKAETEGFVLELGKFWSIQCGFLGLAGCFSSSRCIILLRCELKLMVHLHHCCCNCTVSPPEVAFLAGYHDCGIQERVV